MNRGYEKTEKTYFPRSYDMYHYYRNLVEREVDESLISVSIYGERVTDDTVTHFRTAEKRQQELNRMVKVYVRNLKNSSPGREVRQDLVDNMNTNTTPEEEVTEPTAPFGQDMAYPPSNEPSQTNL